MTGGTVNLASTGAPSGSVIPNQILDVGGDGVVIEANAAGTEINIGSMTLIDSVTTSIAVLNDSSTTTIETVPNTAANPAYTSGIVKNTDGSAIVIGGGSPNFTYFGTILNSPPTTGPGLGYLLQIAGVDAATINISGPGNSPLVDQGDGVFINNVDRNPAGAATPTTVDIVGLNLVGEGSTGILIQNSDNLPEFTFTNTLIGGTTGPTAQGILLSTNSVTTQTIFNNIDISLPSLTADGIRAVNSGIVLATGANTLSTASTTGAAIYAEGATTRFENAASTTFLDFVSVESNNVNGATGVSPPAITPLRAISILDSGPEGIINITGNFTVPINGSNATGENILDAGSGNVIVRVSGTDLTPVD